MQDTVHCNNMSIVKNIVAALLFNTVLNAPYVVRNAYEMEDRVCSSNCRCSAGQVNRTLAFNSTEFVCIAPSAKGMSMLKIKVSSHEKYASARSNLH